MGYETLVKPVVGAVGGVATTLALKKLWGKIINSDDSTPISELEQEAYRAEIKSGALLSESKVEQELAISRRIDTAEEVEIEEYFDTTAKANAGLSKEDNSTSIGFGANGRRVTKRVIKFKGGASIVQEMVDETVQEIVAET